MDCIDRKDLEAQNARLVDIFMVGPLMLYYGLRPSEIHPAARLASTLLGFGTIVFNSRNWIKIRRFQKHGRLEQFARRSVRHI